MRARRTAGRLSTIKIRRIEKCSSGRHTHQTSRIWTLKSLAPSHRQTHCQDIQAMHHSRTKWFNQIKLVKKIYHLTARLRVTQEFDDRHQRWKSLLRRSPAKHSSPIQISYTSSTQIRARMRAVAFKQTIGPSSSQNLTKNSSTSFRRPQSWCHKSKCSSSLRLSAASRVKILSHRQVCLKSLENIAVSWICPRRPRCLSAEKLA